MHSCPITVIIPTYNRNQQLLSALKKILGCSPYPDEVIVHVDANDSSTRRTLSHSLFAQRVKVIQSKVQVGPGGGRTRAIAQAKHEIVASFDDDSYPIDADYFARLLQLFEQFPEAAVIGSAVYHIGETIESDSLTACWSNSFIGCGCAYRKSAFQQTDGYLPLPLAYGMEEVDLVLQLSELNWKVLHSSWLRVFHNTQLAHHTRPDVTAASIANLGLLAYLRYPVSFCWLGVAQCLNRIFWLIRHGRFNGIVRGIGLTPYLIHRYRKARKPISSQRLTSYLQMHKSQQADVDICPETSDFLTAS
ncbi:glycosyltransferase family 2 protein [cf. Phormidesmis sp. LEGE 11477]|uniref:glycosyltransferase family 2 protein n=1 Tax=cf. Phormidesmis sp. LEGE 11477 TaxID=1828680 RepID=UPI00188134B4|nr:glycosyltransferase family 2 protein [cf. Phormidesmis sp. LEGE 11477]MBE9060266.1 glycosyltransferase family 2 protein [cf. Phormidesmis sp. LEGE 11477]